MQKKDKIFLTICLVITVMLFSGCASLSLSQSAIKGDLDSIKSQLKNGENVNQVDQWGWTPLLWATYYDHYTIVDYLLRNGADINFKSTNDQAAPKGSTPLIVASYNGNIGMTKFLLRRGADKNIKNSAGETAHDVAEKYHFTGVIDLLDKQVVQAENP